MRRATLACALLALTASSCFFGEPRVYPNTPRLVPDLRGETVADARVALEEEGLIPQVEDAARRSADPSRCPGAIVTAQDVAPGEAAVSGTMVTLTVDRC